MSAQTPMEVKKDGLRQTQDGIWKLTVTVHPNDMLVSLMTAPMGTRYAMALVEIGDDEKPVEQKPEPKKRLHDEPRSRQMQKMCGVEEFQGFMTNKAGFVPGVNIHGEAYDNTKLRVKSWLGIESSKELDLQDGFGGMKWQTLLAEYEQATGRMAESH